MPTIRSLPPLNLNVQIPLHFRCPISLELMKDPVILSTGQTYDRSSIEKWVASGNVTCPVTMQRLDDFTLIPNHTLRRLIQEWCVANRSRGVERIPTPKQPADPASVRLILSELTSTSGENEAGRILALRGLRNLAKEDERNRMIIAEAGAVPVILSAVFHDVGTVGGDEGHKDGRGDADDIRVLKKDSPRVCSDVSEEGLAAIITLPLNDAERLSVLQNEQKLAFLSSVLRHGSSEARVYAAALIEMLSDSKELPESRVILATADGIMEGLVRLLKDLNTIRAVKVGIKAIFSLCLRRQGKERAVEAGAPDALIEKLSHTEKGDTERALGAIELLCTTEGGCKAVANHAMSVSVLIKVILKVSDRATEYAAGSLLAICNFSEKVQKEAVQAGIIKELLLLIQSDCTHRAKTKAMNLLKLLRSVCDHHLMPDYGRTDVVPF
ncbi:hypothetical protein KP509_08G065500 [Ceratopteris richardii]|uniref:RING-type E3 ubiquitin transferase n=1 Tax=Ceratopteris richardii TaxID=49495 RepID=A0A8T2UE05_CERRI|nr:hypothetical protein KP509_08G065500 [Ceratopteris richardii]